MHRLTYALILLALACNKREEEKHATPIIPTKTIDTFYYEGTLRNVVSAECLNTFRDFDTTYPLTVIVAYPDSTNIRFHFSFVDYDIKYQDCGYVRYEAVRAPEFQRKGDSTYTAGEAKTMLGLITYYLRGDSLLITESGRGSKWYWRYVTFFGKRRQ